MRGKVSQLQGKKTTRFVLLATFMDWLTFLLHDECASIIFPSWEEKQQECGRNDVKPRV